MGFFLRDPTSKKIPKQTMGKRMIISLSPFDWPPSLPASSSIPVLSTMGKGNWKRGFRRTFRCLCGTTCEDYFACCRRLMWVAAVTVCCYFMIKQVGGGWWWQSDNF